MDFNRVIDRRGTLSLKWENPKNEPGLPDIIPLWVADMDFAPPGAVTRAIRERAEHPIFGYTLPAREYAEAVAAWYRSRQGLELDPSAILMAPSVMPSLAAVLGAFTAKGEGAMIMPPVYHPFFSIVEENGRALVEAPLARSADGSWEMDFDRMESAADAAAASGVALKAIVVSSPHNPVGRVWTRPELERLLAFARRRGAAVICDEIHSDIILGDRAFLSMASFEGEDARGLVVLSGPNKTFNIAGLHISQIIARDEATRRAAAGAISAAGYGLPNAFSLAAALAAYREGSSWLDELVAYLRGNLGFLRDFLASRLPEVGLSRLEGSYLAWLDLRALLEGRGVAKEAVDEAALAAALENEARVRLSPGGGYGKEGRGYARLNIATPRSILSEGLERIARYLGR
jgi:cystathionine beta-lyase